MRRLAKTINLLVTEQAKQEKEERTRVASNYCLLSQTLKALKYYVAYLESIDFTGLSVLDPDNVKSIKSNIHSRNIVPTMTTKFPKFVERYIQS